MLKEIKKGFTLAEVLIVIGIIGVVAALTLPNLNHATGDKETVTRLQKAYSILNEANDRAVAIYGPVSTWKSNEKCANHLGYCWMKRIGEFLKISKSCDEYADSEDLSVECDFYGDMEADGIMYQLADNITFGETNNTPDCGNIYGAPGWWFYITDICISELNVDVNGPNKGENKYGKDIFRLFVSDSQGIISYKDGPETIEAAVNDCMSNKDYYCSWWALDYGNLDYLKADENGKCNDSNIILDGTTNTSCH